MAQCLVNGTLREVLEPRAISEEFLAVAVEDVSAILVCHVGGEDGADAVVGVEPGEIGAEEDSRGTTAFEE